MNLLNLANFFKKQKIDINNNDNVSTLNDYIREEIIKNFGHYNNYAIKDYKFQKINNKDCLYLSTDDNLKGITSTTPKSGEAFAFRSDNAPKLEIHYVENRYKKEIIARTFIPVDLIHRFDKEVIKTNVLQLYIEMFNRIVEESDIKPLTPFLGDCYFNIEFVNGKVIRLLENVNAYEIRAYHSYVDPKLFKVL